MTCWESITSLSAGCGYGVGAPSDKRAPLDQADGRAVLCQSNRRCESGYSCAYDGYIAGDRGAHPSIRLTTAMEAPRAKILKFLCGGDADPFAETSILRSAIRPNRR